MKPPDSFGGLGTGSRRLPILKPRSTKEGEPKSSWELVRRIQRRRTMLKKLALAMAAVGILLSTAGAEYYIVQEQATKKCKVVETRPTETTWVQVGPAAFKTQADAQKQIKTVCVEK